MRIVARQAGGLGNQIFQYAAGLYYARRYNADLRIATPFLEVATGGPPRPYQLSQFCITTPARKTSVVERLLGTTNPKLQSAAAAGRRLLGVNVITEPVRHRFYPDLPGEMTAGTVHLRGFWQASPYAAAVESQLRSELVLREAPSGLNLQVLEEIEKSANPVSLHLRRGDYLFPENNFALSLSYYKAAIQKVREAIADPTFFVFSDDINFARKNLADLSARFVDHNDEWSAYEDLRLLAACRHAIIANSSFSWWGAWLNANPKKIIIAPKYWWCRADSHYPELLPQAWMQIDNLAVQ
jgi:hypothetical protein